MSTYSSPDRYLELDGIRLRYRDEGGGVAVVFVHGWALDLDMWQPQAHGLSPFYRVIRMDRRGFGLSRGQPSLEQDVEDLATLLEHLHVPHFALVGMSQGARVALKFACDSPGRILCLILDGPPQIASWHGPQEIPYAQYRTLAQTKGMQAFRGEWSRHPLTRLRTEDPAMRALVTEILERYPGSDLTGPEQTPLPLDLRALAAHALPTLILSGEDDLVSRRESAARLAAQLGRVECAQIARAAHQSNLDNPAAYNRVLKEFIDRHSASSYSRKVPAP